MIPLSPNRGLRRDPNEEKSCVAAVDYPPFSWSRSAIHFLFPDFSELSSPHYTRHCDVCDKVTGLAVPVCDRVNETSI